MLVKIRTVVAIALLTSFASAALARPSTLPIKPEPAVSGCVTDGGQGRKMPCDGPGF